MACWLIQYIFGMQKIRKRNSCCKGQRKFCYTFVTLEDDVLKSPFLSCFFRYKFIQVPSSALKTKRLRRVIVWVFFIFSAEEFLEPKVQGLLATEWLRRSVRQEKGSLDLFLNPSHPIFRGYARFVGMIMRFYGLFL